MEGGCVLGSGGAGQKGREIRKGGVLGSSGLRERRTEGSGVFSVLRDGPLEGSDVLWAFLILIEPPLAISFVPVKHPPPLPPRWAGGLGERGARKRVATWQVSGRFSRWPPEGARGTTGLGERGGEVAFVLLLEVGRGISWRVLGAST